MNRKDKLRLQAYLDNELSGRQSKRTASWVEQEPEARALLAELKEIKGLVAGHELPAPLMESRDFYWSKIQRAIQQQSKGPVPKGFLPGYPRWFKIFAPATGAAVLFIAAFSAIKLSMAPAALSYLHEIETPLEDSSAIVFHSQAAGMTVVWVQTK